MAVSLGLSLAAPLVLPSESRADDPAAKAADKTGPRVVLEQLADGFVSPLNLVPLPDGSGRLLVGDQVGTVHVLDKDGRKSEELFLDLRPKLTPLNQGFDERGLLGLALHPKFAANGRFFLFYSAPRRGTVVTNYDCTSRLSEFKVTPGNPLKGDLTSERVLLEIDKPQMNHNCGRILFGPDGLLYVGVGDGGGANDNEFGHSPQGNGQDTTVLLGKILRLDVDNSRGQPYAIPAGNPFKDGKEGRPEIFAYGLRNPWGLSFDRGGRHELFAVDVGQNLYEELNIIRSGGNYGWRLREGFHPFDPKSPNAAATNAALASSPTVDARGKPMLDPLVEYPHPPRNRLDQTKVVGTSTTGGYVYRGSAVPALEGKYVFADWSRNWALPDGILITATRGSRSWFAKAKPWTVELLPMSVAGGGKFMGYITAMGEDATGELYVLTNGRNSLTGQTGKVYRMAVAQ